jgi:hypothetical protein
MISSVRPEVTGITQQKKGPMKGGRQVASFAYGNALDIKGHY